MVQFVHPTPFKLDLESESIELLPSAMVAGEECHVIRVGYSSGGPSGAETGSTWSLAKSDFLPRRQVRHFAIPQQGEGDLVITLNDLQIDTELDGKLFKLVLPKGYEQIDDFAP
jgi:outer membrane lipoprotein-sorting protein